MTVAEYLALGAGIVTGVGLICLMGLAIELVNRATVAFVEWLLDGDDRR